MDWFNQYIVFSMSGGFFHWFGCWFLAATPASLLAAGLCGCMNAVSRRRD